MQAKVTKTAPYQLDILGESFEEAWVGHQALKDVIPADMEVGEYCMVEFQDMVRDGNRINLRKSDSVPPYRCKECAEPLWYYEPQCPECGERPTCLKTGKVEAYLRDNKTAYSDDIEQEFGYTPFKNGVTDLLVKAGVMDFKFDGIVRFVYND